jgi:hypothetical protein
MRNAPAITIASVNKTVRCLFMTPPALGYDD